MIEETEMGLLENNNYVTEYELEQDSDNKWEYEGYLFKKFIEEYRSIHDN